MAAAPPSALAELVLVFVLPEARFVVLPLMLVALPPLLAAGLSAPAVVAELVLVFVFVLPLTLVALLLLLDAAPVPLLVAVLVWVLVSVLVLVADALPPPAPPAPVAPPAPPTPPVAPATLAAPPVPPLPPLPVSPPARSSRSRFGKSHRPRSAPGRCRWRRPRPSSRRGPRSWQENLSHTVFSFLSPAPAAEAMRCRRQSSAAGRPEIIRDGPRRLPVRAPTLWKEQSACHVPDIAARKATASGYGQFYC